MGKLKFSPASLKTLLLTIVICKLDLHAPTIFCKEVKLYICTFATWFTNELSILQECYQGHSLRGNACNGEFIHMKCMRINQIHISLNVRYSSLHKNAKIVFDTFSEVGNENKFILLIVACVVRKSLNRDISRNRICQIQF